MHVFWGVSLNPFSRMGTKLKRPKLDLVLSVRSFFNIIRKTLESALWFSLINWQLSKSAPLVADPCRSVYIAHKMASDGVENTPSTAILWAIYTDLHGFAHADPCRSVYIAHKMASDGVENTPSTAILWAIYTDLHGFATRGAYWKVVNSYIMTLYKNIL